jgi:hypothetical protein
MVLFIAVELLLDLEILLTSDTLYDSPSHGAILPPKTLVALVNMPIDNVAVY